MHKKAIVHIVSKIRMESSSFSAEIDAMEELSEKYGIKNVIFYKWDVIKFELLIKKLEKFHILLKNYSNKEDLKEQVLEFSEKFEIVFVSTPGELLVNVANEVTWALGLPMSDHWDVFRNKSLQRELIEKNNPKLWIKFLKGTPEELDIEEIEEKVGYPFIIKPVDGLQSSWVKKITKKKEFKEYIQWFKSFQDILKTRGIDTKVLIVEEFIDGIFYSIDYFITPEWKVILSRPIKTKTGVDIWIKDYCNFDAVLTEKTHWEFSGRTLRSYIESMVKALCIRNTFVHHEFKINSKGEYKTIELNGRIWWKRLELMKRAYGINLYEFIVNHDIKIPKIKENNILFFMYAPKRGIFKWYNEELFKKIEARETVFEINYEESLIGKEIWLTSDGFVNVWHIKLKSKSYKSIRKDYLYIKSKYIELLDIEEIKKSKKSILEKPKSKIKNTFSKVKWIFKRKKS